MLSLTLSSNEYCVFYTALKNNSIEVFNMLSYQY
jgi:hypothetical protein